MTATVTVPYLFTAVHTRTIPSGQWEVQRSRTLGWWESVETGPESFTHKHIQCLCYILSQPHTSNIFPQAGRLSCFALGMLHLSCIEQNFEKWGLGDQDTGDEMNGTWNFSGRWWQNNFLVWSSSTVVRDGSSFRSIGPEWSWWWGQLCDQEQNCLHEHTTCTASTWFNPLLSPFWNS